MITIEQLKDVKERTEALERYLDIEGKKVQVEEEQLRTQAPGFWDDAKKAEAQMKKVKALQAWIEGYKEVNNRTEEAEMAMELFREEMVEEHEVDDAYARALTAIEELELKNMLRGEADDMVKALAFEGKKPYFFPTMGGHIWWRTVEESEKWRIQQNIISNHFRALDHRDRRISFGFDFDHVRARCIELEGSL